MIDTPHVQCPRCLSRNTETDWDWELGTHRHCKDCDHVWAFEDDNPCPTPVELDE